MFKDFWARALLKISGSEYHPKRIVTEIALGIPPMDLTLSEISLKFVLKCSSDPIFYALFCQLEATRDHPFNKHVIAAAKYVQWNRSPCSTLINKASTPPFSTVDKVNLCYSKESIRNFTNYKWTENIKKNIPQSDLHDNIEEGTISMERNACNILFPRHSKRLLDSKLLSLLHGSNTHFRKFKCTIARGNNHIISPYCKVCRNVEDDAYHQLYECPRFNCEYRDILPYSNHRKLYGIQILMSPGTEHLVALRNMAQIIFG